MLINGTHKVNDDLLRRYYVAMTRAKKKLFIHTTTNMFTGISASRIEFNQEDYPMPEEVVLQLSHKDVHLGFFKSKKAEILSLLSGMDLEYRDGMLFDLSHRCMAKLSVAMMTKLAEWNEKGYNVKGASVRFIVAWKPKDAPKEESETAVLLADLYLVRN